MRSLIVGLAAAACLALLCPGFAAAAHHEEQLIALEKSAWEAWKNADPGPFEEHLAEGAVLILGDGTRFTRAQAIEMMGSGDCQVAGYELSGFEVHSLGDAVAHLVYKASQDAVCGGEKVPPMLVVGSTWVMKDGAWKNAVYQETVVHAHE